MQPYVPKGPLEDKYGLTFEGIKAKYFKDAETKYAANMAENETKKRKMEMLRKQLDDLSDLDRMELGLPTKKKKLELDREKILFQCEHEVLDMLVRKLSWIPFDRVQHYIRNIFSDIMREGDYEKFLVLSPCSYTRQFMAHTLLESFQSSMRNLVRFYTVFFQADDFEEEKLKQTQKIGITFTFGSTSHQVNKKIKELFKQQQEEILSVRGHIKQKHVIFFYFPEVHIYTDTEFKKNMRLVNRALSQFQSNDGKIILIFTSNEGSTFLQTIPKKYCNQPTVDDHAEHWCIEEVDFKLKQQNRNPNLQYYDETVLLPAISQSSLQFYYLNQLTKELSAALKEIFEPKRIQIRISSEIGYILSQMFPVEEKNTVCAMALTHFFKTIENLISDCKAKVHLLYNPKPNNDVLFKQDERVIFVTTDRVNANSVHLSIPWKNESQDCKIFMTSVSSQV